MQRRNSPSPNPPTPPGQQRSRGAPARGAASAGRGRHPTSGPRARSSRWSRAAPPGRYFSGPSHPAWTGTPRRACPAPMGARAATWRGLPRHLEQLPGRRFPPCSPGRPLPTVARVARRPLRTVITSGETPNSSRGRARLGSTPPGAHAPPEPRAGNTPAPGANSSRDKNVPARHGTAASAPHAQRRPHALPPRRTAPGLTVSSAAAKGRRRPGRAGPDTIWQSTAAAPVAPSSRLRDTQPRASSGSCGGGRRSTTSPSRPLASSPPPRPAAMATRRQGTGPAPPSVPPPAAGPGFPPAS